MTATLHAVRFGEALEALDWILGWRAPSFMPVGLGRDRVTFWHRCGRPGDGARLARVVRWHDERRDVEIRLGVPHRSPSAGGAHGASALWVVVEGSEQVRRAHAFKPRPSVVMRAGTASRRWLIWPLAVWLPHADVKAANRKIAYALRARQKDGDPDVVWFPAPGTCLREGRSRPAPVVVSRLDAAAFRPDEVVGRLKEPPEVTWMEGR